MTVLPAYTTDILRLYAASGFEAYVVGGAARDILMGKEPSDYDIATDALPDEGLKILQDAGIKTVDTSKRHGTIVAVTHPEQTEITTFRVDGDYKDSRHPESVTLTRNIEEDVKRRDFTMNALYLCEDGTVKDLVGGVSDIENKIIRTCGEPEKRFTEDALRILRALRFSACLGFTIEESTKKAIMDLYPTLNNISRERIRSELSKLLCGQWASAVVREYLEVFALFVPELLRMRGFDQHSKYHDKDLLEHTLSVLDNIPLPRDTNLAFAALLHDVGKPDVFKMDEDGYGHMKLHHIESEKIAKRFLEDYKFSNNDRDEISELIYEHDTFPESRAAVRKMLTRHEVSFIRKLTVLQRADINSHSDYGKNRMQILDKREAVMEQLLAEEDCFRIRDLKVDGKDLIGLGVPEGPKVGSVLKDVFDKVTEGELHNDREELLLYIRSIL